MWNVKPCCVVLLIQSPATCSSSLIPETAASKAAAGDCCRAGCLLVTQAPHLRLLAVCLIQVDGLPVQDDGVTR